MGWIKTKHFFLTLSSFILLNTFQYPFHLIGCPKGKYYFCNVEYVNVLALFYFIVFLIFVSFCLRYVIKGYTLLFKNN